MRARQDLQADIEQAAAEISQADEPIMVPRPGLATLANRPWYGSPARIRRGLGLTWTFDRPGQWDCDTRHPRRDFRCCGFGGTRCTEGFEAPSLGPAMPAGWEMLMPGYAVDHGQTKQERSSTHYVRWCDARGGRVRVHAEDAIGVPAEVVLACIQAARDYPEEFAV